MIAAFLIATNMCLQGGEPLNVSRYVAPTAGILHVRVRLNPANGTLVIYSPGYEQQEARFTNEESAGAVPFAEPVLCIKAIGGPFEFDIEFSAVEDAD